MYQEQINYYYPKTRSCIIKALQQQHALEEHPLHHDIIPSQHQHNNDAHQYQFQILHRFYQFRSPVTRIPVRIATHSTSTTIHSTTTHNNNDDNGTTSRNHNHHHHHSHNDTDMNDTVETTTSHVVLDDDTTTTTWQLEQRLRQLNATLPIHLKSEEEVQRQRHEQLRRIGVPTSSLSSTSNPDHHLYSSGQPPFSSSLLDTIPGRPRRHGPDDEIQYIDPVDAIIAQVTEEVRLLPLQQSSLEPEPDLEEEIMDLNREVQEYWIKEQLLLTKDDENDKDEENDNEDDEHENDDSDDKDDDDDTTDSMEGNR